MAVTDACWASAGDEDCVRLDGVAPGATVAVRPGGAVIDPDLPPMAGRLVRHHREVCFVPRFPFVDGTAYTILVDDVVVAVLRRPGSDRPASTEVLNIFPGARRVPRNLLRLYVQFSAPMSEGFAEDHIRLVDEAGDTLTGALLTTGHELWDSPRRRLTVLLDPARIKRGLVGHREAGYPLRSGESFRLEVDSGFRDARGTPLRTRAERRYEVGGDERRRIDPTRWVRRVPPCHSLEPFAVAFDRPLDRGLLTRCLHVVGPDGRRMAGTQEIGSDERSWRLVPVVAWEPGSHRLVVDHILEDLAGNSVSRVFDRDLTRGDDEPGDERPVTVPFCPR